MQKALVSYLQNVLLSKFFKQAQAKDSKSILPILIMRKQVKQRIEFEAYRIKLKYLILIKPVESQKYSPSVADSSQTVLVGTP